MSCPRAVTERVHSFNKGVRPGEAAEKLVRLILRVSTYDLKEFFSNVDRAKFMEDLRELINLIKAEDHTRRWF